MLDIKDHYQEMYIHSTATKGITKSNPSPAGSLKLMEKNVHDAASSIYQIEKKVYGKPSDDQAWLMIKEQTGATSSTAFQQLTDEIKRDTLRQLKDSGASHRQLERLTGVGRGLIQKL